MKLTAGVIRNTMRNPRETLFMTKFARAAKKASKKRIASDAAGEHIPAFLIASITSSCNLHCAGCYSRQNHACSDEPPAAQLSKEDWDKIFKDADSLGVSFILLAGGEPLLRRDVITAAANHKNILFPIFTNGYFLGEQYLKLFDDNRNLVPIISTEGNEKKTDERRGAGVYQRILKTMDSLKDSGLIFGASVTVTTENMKEVYSDGFISFLKEKGCKAVIFVEYVPVTEETRNLAPGEEERLYMSKRMNELSRDVPEMIYLAFPGDEKSFGGCVAAGKGFFHINSHGGAEPCPFSPYSDINVKETSLKEALHSKLFKALRENEILSGEHDGGCVLFFKRAQVEGILANSREEV